MNSKGSMLNFCNKNLSNKLKYTKLDIEMDDKFELDMDDIDDIDKEIDENCQSADSGFKFNRTFKGSLSG